MTYCPPGHENAHMCGCTKRMNTLGAKPCNSVPPRPACWYKKGCPQSIPVQFYISPDSIHKYCLNHWTNKKWQCDLPAFSFDANVVDLKYCIIVYCINSLRRIIIKRDLTQLKLYSTSILLKLKHKLRISFITIWRQNTVVQCYIIKINNWLANF